MVIGTRVGEKVMNSQLLSQEDIEGIRSQAEIEIDSIDKSYNSTEKEITFKVGEVEVGKTLYVPNGCTYYIPSGTTGYT